MAATTSKAAYQAHANKLFESTIEEFQAHFKATYSADLVALIGGHSFNHDQMLEHLIRMRSMFTSIELKVTKFLVDGNEFAERHSGDGVVAKDGSKSHVEAYAFGEIDADGKISVFEEAVIVTGAHPMKELE